MPNEPKRSKTQKEWLARRAAAQKRIAKSSKVTKGKVTAPSGSAAEVKRANRQIDSEVTKINKQLQRAAGRKRQRLEAERDAWQSMRHAEKKPWWKK